MNITGKSSRTENFDNMAQSVNLVPAFLLLLLVQGARSQQVCTPASVDVEQTSIAEEAGSDLVFEVTVRNRCACAVRGVFLRTFGFSSSMPVDPNLFRREGDGYLVGNGARIEKGGEVRFRYAWDRSFEMEPAAVQDDCS